MAHICFVSCANPHSLTHSLTAKSAYLTDIRAIRATAVGPPNLVDVPRHRQLLLVQLLVKELLVFRPHFHVLLLKRPRHDRLHFVEGKQPLAAARLVLDVPGGVLPCGCFRAYNNHVLLLLGRRGRCLVEVGDGALHAVTPPSDRGLVAHPLGQWGLEAVPPHVVVVGTFGDKRFAGRGAGRGGDLCQADLWVLEREFVVGGGAGRRGLDLLECVGVGDVKHCWQSFLCFFLD